MRKNAHPVLVGRLIVASALLAGAASPSFAGAIDGILQVSASNAQGSGSLDIPSGALGYDPGTDEWFYNLVVPADIMSGPEVIATVTGLTLYIQGDPTISLGFAVTAGASDTSFTISSPTLSFAPIANPTATASAGITATDANSNGVATTGNNPGGTKSYFASVSTGLFAQLVDNLSAGINGTDSDAEPRAGPVAGPVNSMNSSFGFTLTARDSAGGTSVFVVVPEPTTLALLGFAVLPMLRRRPARTA